MIHIIKFHVCILWTIYHMLGSTESNGWWENDNRWCTYKIKESFNELGLLSYSYSKVVTVKPLLCPIETTMCSRVSPVSVRKFGLSPRLIIALNLSTFLDLTLSSIWYWDEEILHLRLNSGSLCTSWNIK